MLDVAEHGVRPDELARAKGQMRGQTVLAYEGPVSRMTRLGGNALIGDDRTLEDLLECYDAVSSEEVQRVAAELFSDPPVWLWWARGWQPATCGGCWHGGHHEGFT